MSYIFPFDTCERVNKDNIIMQPYSFIFNLINLLIILNFLFFAKNKLFIGSIFLFQLLHTISHMQHISGSTQVNVIHFTAYLINISFLYTIYNITNHVPSKTFLILILILMIVDIYSYMNNYEMFYIGAQVFTFIGICFYYMDKLPLKISKNIYKIAILMTITLFFIINEIYNCKLLLQYYPNIPFHIMVEIGGIATFYYICKTFYL